MESSFVKSSAEKNRLTNAVNGKNSFIVYREKLRDRRTPMATRVIPVVVTAVLLFEMGGVLSKVTMIAREEASVAMVGGSALWPSSGIGPLHFMFTP